MRPRAQASPDATTTTPPVPRRLLLVTGSMGEGHHAAARAVEERARELWPGVEVVWTDTLDGMGRGTAPLFRGIYAGCVRRLPWLYALYFALLCRVAPFRAVTRAVIGAWSAPGLAAQVRRHRPDLVVATFPEGITGLARLRRRGRLPVPAVALVADPAPHPLWADAVLDLHLVSTGPGAELLLRYAPGARVRVAAPPVLRRFHPPAAERPGPPRVLVSCGSLAFGDVAGLCAAVLDARADVLVSAGRDPGLRRRLDRLAATHPRGAALEVRDWIDDPADATRACDAVVTNAGGATALEAIACARALLLVDPVPGHGVANARTLAAAGLARLCDGPAELGDAVRALADPAARAAAVETATTHLAGLDLDADVAALARLAPGEPVRAADGFFLAAETATVPQQVGAVLVLAPDPGPAPPDGSATGNGAPTPSRAASPDGATTPDGGRTPDGAATPGGGTTPGGAANREDWPGYLRDLVRDRAGRIDLLGRTLRPAGTWERDPAPDPARHVRAEPFAVGPDRPLRTWDDAATAFFGTPLDPAVGWELAAATGPDGTVAVLARAHHALGDGLVITDALFALLTDESATPAAPRPPVAPERPGGPDVVRRLRAGGRLLAGLGHLATMPPAGRSPLTGGVSGPAHRRIGCTLDGREVRAAARAHGVGTTALLLAVLADALHGTFVTAGTPSRRARAMVPITTRTRAGSDVRAGGNRMAVVPVDLPTGPMDPAERVARVARLLERAGSGGRPEAASAAVAGTGRLPRSLRGPVVRLVHGRRFFHLVTSVMPGMRRPVHVRGLRLTEIHPVLPLAGGVGLAVGALHCGSRTCLGVTADQRIPQVEGIPSRLRASLRSMQRS